MKNRTIFIILLASFVLNLTCTGAITVNNFGTVGYDQRFDARAQAATILREIEDPAAAARLERAIRELDSAYMKAAACILDPYYHRRAGQISVCVPLVDKFNRTTTRLLTMTSAISSN